MFLFGLLSLWLLAAAAAAAAAIVAGHSCCDRGLPLIWPALVVGVLIVAPTGRSNARFAIWALFDCTY